MKRIFMLFTVLTLLIVSVVGAGKANASFYPHGCYVEAIKPFHTPVYAQPTVLSPIINVLEYDLHTAMGIVMNGPQAFYLLPKHGHGDEFTGQFGYVRASYVTEIIGECSVMDVDSPIEDYAPTRGD